MHNTVSPSDIYITPFDKQPSSPIKKEEIWPEERDKLLAGIFWWWGEAESYFLYKGKGAVLYEKILADPRYVCFRKGMRLIENNADKLSKYVGKNFTDKGSGTGVKASTILQKVDHDVNYFPIDGSPEMMKIARKKLAENPRVHTDEWILTTEGRNNLAQWLENNTYLYTWGTVGNFSRRKNIEDFRNMGNRSYFKGNHLIFDYFSAPTQKEIDEEVLPSYDNDAVQAWFENGLEMLWLSTDDFAFHVKYVKDPPGGIMQDGQKVFPWSIQCWFIAKKDWKKTLDNGRKLSVEEGQFCTILSSQRFADQEIDDLLRQSGTQKVKVDLQQEPGMKLVVAKKRPSQLVRCRKKIKMPLWITLAVGAGWGGNKLYDAGQEQILIDQAKKIRSDGRTVQGVYGEYVLDADAFMVDVWRYYDYLQVMYDLSKVSKRHQEEIRLLLASELGEMEGNGHYTVMSSIDIEGVYSSQNKKVYPFFQKFIKKYARFLAQCKVPVGKEYAHLEKYASNFEETCLLEEDIDLGERLKNMPVNPVTLPSLSNIEQKFGRNSLELEKAIQERNEMERTYRQWEKQQLHDLQPIESLWDYWHTDGCLYTLARLRNWIIVATHKGLEDDFSTYSTVITKHIWRDYCLYFRKLEKADENSLLANE